MTLDTPPQHDSDSMIPPQQQHAPHSYIPFMKAPSSIGTIPLSSSGRGQPGSQPGTVSSHGASRSSWTSRSSGEDLAPFSMAGLKDWELDLDALEVRLARWKLLLVGFKVLVEVRLLVMIVWEALHGLLLVMSLSSVSLASPGGAG